jgi:hypothetical protein
LRRRYRLPPKLIAVLVRRRAPAENNYKNTRGTYYRLYLTAHVCRWFHWHARKIDVIVFLCKGILGVVVRGDVQRLRPTWKGVNIQT